MADKSIPYFYAMTPETPTYLVDQLLRIRSVNLCAGPVGAGKTTVEFQLAECVAHGEPFLGFPTRRSRVAFVTLDRDRVETEETATRLKLRRAGGEEIRVYPADEILGAASLASMPTLEHLIDVICPHYRLVIVEPINYLLRDTAGKLGNPNNLLEVWHFFLRVRQALQRYDSCILGSIHTAKIRNDGSGYANPRERISGASAWTANTSTTIIVDFVEASNPVNPFRSVSILPRNAPNLQIDCRLDEATGRLEEIPISDKYLACWDEIVDAKPSAIFDNTDLKRWAVLCKVHPRTIRRFLDQLVTSGELEDAGYGCWRKRKLVKTNPN